MNVDFAFICDYAEVVGKIYALGIGFDTIFAPSVPAKHPLFTVVIQLRAQSVESGEKDLRINLIDADGKEIIPTLQTKINIQKPLSGTESIGRIAFRFNNVQFPQYGAYSLHAVIDGHEMVRIPLRVSPPPATA